MVVEDFANLYRVRLCHHAKKCVHPNCGFAHSLAELRAPNETNRVYPEVWEKGVDRWFGQSLNEEQLKLIREYYDATPERNLPQWARALRYVFTGKHDIRERHFCWDYGMSTEVDLLCRHRKDRRLPFDFHHKVWERLEERKHMLWETHLSRVPRDASP